MIIKRIEGATRILGKAQGYMGLPLRDEMIDIALGDGQVMQAESMLTAWEPTPEELEKLNKGAVVLLRVLGVGHPPVMLSVGDTPETKS